jgi:hypothetical protein
MFKDTVCSLAELVSTHSLGSERRAIIGKSWHLTTCARHWKLPSLSSTTPTSEIIDLHFLLFISELGDISDITSLYSSHLLTLHLFLFIALSLSRKIFLLRRVQATPAIWNHHQASAYLTNLHHANHSTQPQNFTMRSLIPFFVLILLGVKAHPHVSNPHQVLFPNQRNVDIDLLNEGAGFQRPVHTTELMALATAGAGRGGPV